MSTGPDPRDPSGFTPAWERWRALVDVVSGLGEPPDLASLLRRAIEVAASLLDTRYAVLAVRATDGSVDPVRVEQVGGGDELDTWLRSSRDGSAMLADLAGREVSGTIEVPVGTGTGPLPAGSMLATPVRMREKVLATVALGPRRDGQDFTAEDEAVLLAFGAAVGVAAESAMHREEAGRREDWLGATAEITATLTAPQSERDPMQVVADQARSLSGAATTWVLSGKTPDDLEFRAISGTGIDVGYLRTLPLGESPSTQVVRSGRPLRVENFSTDARIARHGTLPGAVELGQAILVPLSSSEGVEGVLGMAWTPEDRAEFDHLDVALPAGFAQQAALALQVLRAQRDQQHLAVLRDRDRIGRDLHDVVIQRLFAVGLGLASMGRLDAVEQEARVEESVGQIDEAISDVRRAIHALGRVGTGDLPAQVAEVVDRAVPALGFRPLLRLGGQVRTRVPEELATEVVAVLTEALSNVARHARATQAQAELAVADDEVRLRVNDDGIGITDDVHRSGLANMARRAERLGGSCTIEAAPDGGTRVDWRVPLGFLPAR